MLIDGDEARGGKLKGVVEAEELTSDEREDELHARDKTE